MQTKFVYSNIPMLKMKSCLEIILKWICTQTEREDFLKIQMNIWGLYIWGFELPYVNIWRFFKIKFIVHFKIQIKKLNIIFGKCLKSMYKYFLYLESYLKWIHQKIHYFCCGVSFKYNLVMLHMVAISLIAIYSL